MLKILIAEDDLMIADMTEDVLITNGYEVCGIARTVGEAVALAQHHKPDLAIIDMRLADGGLGTQIADELKPASFMRPETCPTTCSPPTMATPVSQSPIVRRTSCAAWRSSPTSSAPVARRCRSLADFRFSRARSALPASSQRHKVDVISTIRSDAGEIVANFTIHAIDSRKAMTRIF
jgi:CheY-like chemotaxis protein